MVDASAVSRVASVKPAAKAEHAFRVTATAVPLPLHPPDLLEAVAAVAAVAAVEEAVEEAVAEEAVAAAPALADAATAATAPKTVVDRLTAKEVRWYK